MQQRRRRLVVAAVFTCVAGFVLSGCFHQEAGRQYELPRKLCKLDVPTHLYDPVFGPGEDIHVEFPQDWAQSGDSPRTCTYDVGAVDRVSMGGNWNYKEENPKSVRPPVIIRESWGGEPRSFGARFDIYTWQQGAEAAIDCELAQEHGRSDGPDRFNLSLHVSKGLFDVSEKRAHKVFGKLMLAVTERVAKQLQCAGPVRNG